MLFEFSFSLKYKTKRIVVIKKKREKIPLWKICPKGKIVDNIIRYDVNNMV